MPSRLAPTKHDPTRQRAARLALAALLLPLLLSACLRAPAPASGVLHGVVNLPDGSPASGASLTLVPEPGSASTVQRTTTTDANGSFRLERVRVGVYWLTAQVGTSHSAVMTGVEVLDGEETTVTVSLTAAGRITGLANLSDRPEEGGVRVSVAGTPFTVTSGTGGAYDLPGVPSGVFDVAFTAAGYAPVTVADTLVVSGQPTALPAVTLQRVAPYASFTAFVNGNDVQVDASASTDPNGRIVRYVWDFGDGTRVQGGPENVRVTHRYAMSGDVTIRLTVTNQAGHSDTTSQTVLVTLPQLRVGSGPFRHTVPARSNAHFDVVLPTGAGRGILYIEVENGVSIQVRRGAEVFFDTAAGTFRRLANNATADDAKSLGQFLTPQAIGVGRACRGPCVLLPATTGASLTVHNPGPTQRQVVIHLVTEGFDDLNEPNDVPAAATLLVGEESGAIELVGDVDWFRVAEEGILTFEPPRAMAARARHFSPGGVLLGTLPAGSGVRVLAGDLVEVSAVQAEAGPSGVSVYFLTLERTVE